MFIVVVVFRIIRVVRVTICLCFDLEHIQSGSYIKSNKYKAKYELRVIIRMKINIHGYQGYQGYLYI